MSNNSSPTPPSTPRRNQSVSGVSSIPNVSAIGNSPPASRVQERTPTLVRRQAETQENIERRLAAAARLQQAMQGSSGGRRSHRRKRASHRKLHHRRKSHRRKSYKRKTHRR